MGLQAVLFHTELPSSFLKLGCCWQGWGKGAAALCCSVNAQLLQPKAAKIHPSPLKFRESFMLAAHMINQTTYLLPGTLIPNGNSQDSSIQKDRGKKVKSILLQANSEH